MVSDFVQADIFFFITSIAVVVLTITLVVTLVYVIQILRDVRYVSKKMREESDRIIVDVEQVRRFVVEEGRRAVDFKEVIAGVVGMIMPKKRKPRGKRANS